MKKKMAKYLFIGLICGIMIFNLARCAIKNKVDQYTMTSTKDASKIIGNTGLILIKINGKPGPLNNFRGIGFSPSRINAYNNQNNTFEVNLEPGEYTLEFDFFYYYRPKFTNSPPIVRRAKDFALITLRVDRSKCYYLDFSCSSNEKWRVYVSKVE